MPFYTAPDIITDVDHHPQQLPEPLAEALQRQLQSYRTVEAPPIIERTGGIENPDVPYDYGWHQWPVTRYSPEPRVMYIPMSAPDVMTQSPAFSQQLAQAAAPPPRRAYTGVFGPLRAPGINEGYS